GLDGLEIFGGFERSAVVAKRGLQALIDLGGDVRLQPNVFGREVKVRVFGLRSGKGADVIVTAMRQRAGEVCKVEKDIVLGGLSGVEFGLGGRAPSVGLEAVIRK